MYCILYVFSFHLNAVAECLRRAVGPRQTWRSTEPTHRFGLSDYEKLPTGHLRRSYLLRRSHAQLERTAAAGRRDVDRGKERCKER